MGQLFYSYSRKDAAQAREIVSKLQAEGFLVWQDIGQGDDGIPPGTDWLKIIQEKIVACDGIILQWSANAKASYWVEQEIGMAVRSRKPFFPVLLDNTDLPLMVNAANSVAPNELDRLMNALPNSSRREVRTLEFGRPLEVQPDAKFWDRLLEGVQIVSVPLLLSSCNQAHIVGPVGTLLEEPKHLMLCAQFSGEQSNLFLSQAMRFFNERYPDQPRLVVHVTPKTIRRGEYRLDDTNYAEWVDAADTCIAATRYFSQNSDPDIHVFGKMPVVLGVLLGTRFPAATTLHLYNDIPRIVGGGFTYELVAKVTTR